MHNSNGNEKLLFDILDVGKAEFLYAGYLLSWAQLDKNHYPYTVALTISGMTCAKCALRVENALNSLPGIWARVDLGTRGAVVRGKKPMDSDSLRQAVRQSGYIVTEVKDASVHR